MARARFALLAAVALASGCASTADPRDTPEVVVGFETARESFDAAAIDDLNALARRVRNAGDGAVLVEGHADRQGSTRFNEALSARRARAVREDLIARGLPRSVVTATAMGERAPVVPTADGVAEPQNRRVVVTRSAPGTLTPPDPEQPIRFALPKGRPPEKG